MRKNGRRMDVQWKVYELLSDIVAESVVGG